MKVAFPYIDRRLWQGGYNYLHNLVGALDELGSRPILPVVYAGDDISEADLLAFRNIECATVVRDRHFRRGNSWHRQLAAVTTGRDKTAEEIYLSHGISGIFENAFFHGAKSKLPTLMWIPDLQHKHLPHLFSSTRYWKREIGFRMQLAYGGDVLLSSADAKNDLRKFYPRCKKPIHILRFCAALPPTILGFNRAELTAKYDLPESFIYLPNQFYFHKNHTVVVNALDTARTMDKNVSVVASGSVSGASSSNSIDSVRTLVSNLKLESKFIILGSIPYEHVLGLMLASSAVLNPSLFEGWSTTVEEAKALEAPLILSDINVHREQAGDSAMFFQPQDHNELAEKMIAAIETKNRGTSRDRIATLANINYKNRIDVARHFSDILKKSFSSGQAVGR